MKAELEARAEVPVAEEPNPSLDAPDLILVGVEWPEVVEG